MHYQDKAGEIFVLGTTLINHSSCSCDQIFQLLRNNSLETALPQLDGLFLIIYHDSSSQKLLIVNNNYQLTKLYYTHTENEFLFAHQMELLLPFLKQRQVHFPSLMNFLRNGFNQSEFTQIEGIKKLLPSQWIEVSPDGVQIHNRWSSHFKVHRQPIEHLESHIDEYENIYQSSVENYLKARKPSQLGMLLSGGHDTSFLLIQASKVHSDPIHCFTTVFSNWGFSEESYAEATCKKFGGHFHPREFAGSDLDLLIDLVNSCEEPVLGSSLPLHSLAQYASQTTDTIMGGDGGDTLWGEYHPVDEYHRWVQSWPQSLRKLAHTLALLLRKTSDWERFWELEHVARLFTQKDFYKHFLGNLCTYRHFSDRDLSALLNPDIAAVSPARSQMEISFNRDNFSEALIEGKLLNGFFTYQSFQQTRSMNSFGMEFFLPTVQKDVMNFINALPMNWINGGTTFHRLINSKSMNRKFHKFALARYLKKEEIYNRSFDIPWHLIWKDRHQTLELAKTAIKKRGWYQSEKIDDLFTAFVFQKNKDYELLELKSHGYRIMTLLAIEIWARIYIDGIGSSGVSQNTKLDDLLG